MLTTGSVPHRVRRISKHAGGRQMNATRVLCVQNHPEYMGALKYMLEAAGYEVMAATTGGQGLRLLTDLHIDGVLLEYDLRDAPGSTVRAEMKRIKPEFPRPVASAR